MTAQTVPFGGREVKAESAYSSNFRSLDDFWWEGTPDVSVAGGSLFVRTTLTRDDRHHFISSVFCRRRFQGDVMVEFDVRSVHPQSQRNFNFFIHTSLVDGRDLFETRGERTGDYPEYHGMNNYLFTFLPGRVESEGDKAPEFARLRFRRNPGFRLMKEIYSGSVVNDRWYHFQYVVLDGLVACAVDRHPQETYGWCDSEPLREGYLGFRTFCSHMEYRELRVWNLK